MCTTMCVAQCLSKEPLYTIDANFGAERKLSTKINQSNHNHLIQSTVTTLVFVSLETNGTIVIVSNDTKNVQLTSESVDKSSAGN